MLKTISYSIVFVSKSNKQTEINDIFDIVNNIRTIRRDVLQTIFDNVNDIQEQGDPFLKVYSMNNYTIKFEKPLRRMIIEYIGEITDEVEENIKKIAQTIINIIIEEKKEDINKLVSAVGLNYDFVEKKEKPLQALKNAIKNTNDNLAEAVFALTYTNKDNNNIKLNLTIFNDRRVVLDQITYKANLDIQINENNKIEDMLKIDHKNFITEQIKSLKI